MDNWIKNELCTGCNACANCCPVDAIDMVINRYGFKYPFINSEKCIECGLCENTCPILHRIINKNNEHPKIYAAWSLNEETRYNSTSGGVFSEFARYVYSKGGSVVGAVYDHKNLVRHVVTDNEDDLDQIRQSKYLQSDIGLVFRDIKKLLCNGTVVGFCGSPCQVSGLLNYLAKPYDNLYTFDFICRGANSPKAYEKWLEDLEKKYRSKATRVWFKNKTDGWNRFSTRVDFANGKVYRKDRYHDLFMRGYLEKNLYIRPSCSNCHFKGLPREADITLADFWGVDKSLDCDLGTSMIIVNSKAGSLLMKSIQDSIVCTERSLKEAVTGNSMMHNSVWISRFSTEFLDNLDSYSFQKAFNKIEKKMKRFKKKHSRKK